MNISLKFFFKKSFILLAIIHLCYFIYGYYKFGGIKNIDIYTEFYRFKFYDDVSISHFFVTSIFLFLFLCLLLIKHSNKISSLTEFFKASFILLLITFLSFSFFISYSLGQNLKLKLELSEKEFIKDSFLLNTLNPFLYDDYCYKSDELFNVQSILYPEPFPVIEATDTIYYSDDKKSFYSDTNYYSIDTIKMLKSNFDKVDVYADTIFDFIGFDKKELTKRILSKTTVNDSIKIIYKGREVNPMYQDSICVFLYNKTLISPINNISVKQQQFDFAKIRYELLYKFKQDSLLHKFQTLDTLFKKYKIETSIIPQELTKNVLKYKNEEFDDYYPEFIGNNFDRKTLVEKFETLNRLFYKPQYFHESIRIFYFSLIFIAWSGLVLFFLISNFRKIKQL